VNGGKLLRSLSPVRAADMTQRSAPVRLSENLNRIAGCSWPLGGTFRRSHRGQSEEHRNAVDTTNESGDGRDDIAAGFASGVT
jgi:hypothetical protein